MPLAQSARTPVTYYAVAGTTNTTTCDAGNPCSLTYLGGASSPAVGDDTVYLKASGGSYKPTTVATYTLSVDGTPGHPITFKSNPGEVAVFDSYVTTTVTTTFTSTTTAFSLTLTDGTYFPNGTEVQIDNDTILLGGKSGNTYSSCLGARAGSSQPVKDAGGQAHVAGATVIKKTDYGVEISGDYVYLQNVEIKSSSPNRTTNYPLGSSSNASNYSGQGAASPISFTGGSGSKLINSFIHDNRQGPNIDSAAQDVEIYGCAITNNGYRGTDPNDRADSCGGHGAGSYDQSSNITLKLIESNAVWDNFSVGMKAYSTASQASGFSFIKNALWLNNRLPCVEAEGLSSVSAKQNLEIATEQVPISAVTVQQNYLYHPAAVTSRNLWVGQVDAYRNLVSSGGATRNLVTVGSSSAVNTTTDTITTESGSPFYAANIPVTFTTTGTLPGGLSAATTYYIKTVTASNLDGDAALEYQYTLSATPGGSTLDLTSAGTGTQSLSATVPAADPVTDLIAVESGSPVFVAGLAVKFYTTGTLPSPLVAGTTYFIKTAANFSADTDSGTENVYTLSATQGGATLNLTTAGTGTNTIYVPSVYSITDNVVDGGLKALEVQGADSLTMTGNRFSCQGSTTTSRCVTLFSALSGAPWTVNTNAYNVTTGISAPFKKDTTNYTFANWQSVLGFDAAGSFSTSVPSSQVVTIIPNRYEVGRALIVIRNPAGTSPVSVNLTSVGLANGGGYEMREVERYGQGATIVGAYLTASPTISVTVAPSGTPDAPFGWTGVQSSPTARPYFAVFEIRSSPEVPGAPLAPSSLAASWSFVAQGQPGNITLTWVDNSSNESGFKVYKATDCVNYTLLTTTAADVTSYLATGLTAGAQCFRVAATNASGDSNFAGPVTEGATPVSCYAAVCTR